jgi:anti-anti-sigma factor
MADIVQREEHGFGLSGELNIYSAARLWPELLQALEAAERLEISLAGLEDLDTAGVQVLLMLRREAARQGKPLVFCGHSPAAREVIGLYRLTGELGEPLPDPQQQGVTPA